MYDVRGCTTSARCATAVCAAAAAALPHGCTGCLATSGGCARGGPHACTTKVHSAAAAAACSWSPAHLHALPSRTPAAVTWIFACATVVAVFVAYGAWAVGA